MRKILLSAIALLALAFASCSKNELDPVKENKYTYTIKASINSFGTKTTMMGNTVNWEEGDQIALFANDGSKSLFTLSEGAGSSEGVFGTSENIDGKTFVAALYPYNAEASYADGTISTTSAKEYNWAEGKNNKAIMAAKITDPGSVVFKNAGAVIVLTVNNIPAGYNKIVLSSGVAVNGTTTISFTDDIPTATMNADSDENKSVTINFDKSVAVTDKTFYFPVAITSEAAPFNVNLYDGTASKNLVSDKYTLVERNNRYYKTINFDSNGNPPTQAGTSDEINEFIRNGVTNFILDQNATDIEITEETVEQLQIAIGSTGDNFSISGEGAKGGIILCTPDNIKNLDVDTPNATVEVRPDAGVASFTTITAKTSENTFVIPAGTTVGQMIVKGGNVRVMGTVNIFTNSKGSIVKIYKEEGAVIPQELDANEFEVVDYASESFIKSKEDLIASLAAASDGDVISLGKDIENLTDILVIGKAITLDGQGHTISSTAGRAINVSGVAGSVTIKNLNIIAAGERAINIIQNSKNITIENVKAAASNYCVNVAASAPEATVTINNSDLTGLNTVNIGGTNTTLNISNTKITCNDQNNDESYAAITLNQDAVGSTATITGGSITINGDSYAGSITNGSTITFYGTKGNTTVIGIKCVIEYNDGSYYGYTNLDDAIKNARVGETIKLIDDINLLETIKIEKEITINLNGKTVTANCKKAFEVYADATIKNGTINSLSRCVDTRTNVNLNLENVNLIADKYHSTYGNPQPLTIGGSTHGTIVTLTDVNIDAGKSGYCIISFVQTELDATNCILTGYSAYYAKGGSEASTFDFNNCSLTGDCTNNDVEGNSFAVIAIQSNSVTVNVNGGSVIAKGNNMFAIGIGSTTVTNLTSNAITVKGATITGNILSLAEDDLATNTVIIPDTESNRTWISEEGLGYTQNDDGTITIKKN